VALSDGSTSQGTTRFLPCACGRRATARLTHAVLGGRRERPYREALNEYSIVPVTPGSSGDVKEVVPLATSFSIDPLNISLVGITSKSGMDSIVPSTRVHSKVTA